MTSALLMKGLLWLVLIVGLIPPLIIIGGTLVGSLKNYEDPDLSKNDTPLTQGEMFVVTRHAGFSVGPLTISFHPRIWPAALGAVGIVFLVTGLFVLLHLPIPPKWYP